MNPDPIRQSTIHFTGHVQGVGFRYAVLQIAKGYEVTGLVRNLVDGRVQLIAEGNETEVEHFVAMVGERMAGYIRSVERTDTNTVRQYRGFAIQ